MSIKLTRPIAADGVRLYYRTKYDIREGMVGGHYRGHMFIPPKNNSEKGLFRLMDPDNVMTCIRLYRWFLKEYERVKLRADGNWSGLIQKDDLMNQCFQDWPSVGKHRVGRLLRLIVQYETNFQRNRTDKMATQMFWRWTHPLDIVYGLEHLMLTWLPKVVKADDGSCETIDDLMEEFEILRDQTKEEDHALIEMILEKNLR
jgi:hypothetical protein